jgi:hypothetical protein
MKEMTKHVPDASSYAPVTVLVDERADGVHISYDRMASLLAPYGNPDALKVARDLDAKLNIFCNKLQPDTEERVIMRAQSRCHSRKEPSR